MKRKTGFASFALMITALMFGCGSEASGDEIVRDESAPNSVAVSNYTLNWSFEDASIEILVSAPTTGWVAIGFEPSSAMKDANIIIGYVQDGEVFVRDDWGDGHISHSADTDLGGTSNVTEVSGSEVDGITEITFTIPLDSGDEYDRILGEGNTYKVILAYGPDDADNFQGFHAWVETIELEL